MNGALHLLVKIILVGGSMLMLARAIAFSKADVTSPMVIVERPSGWIQLFPKVHIFLYVVLVTLVAFTDLGMLVILGKYSILLRSVGAIIYSFGTTFALWGADSLGNEKTMDVRIRKGHQLVSSGAYTIVRHPLYLGGLCIWWGSGLLLLNWPILLVALSFTPLFLFRAHVEEELLTRYMGKTYEIYKREVPMLIPNLFLKKSLSEKK